MVDEAVLYPSIILGVILVASVVVFFNPPKRRVVALDPERWINFPLSEIEQISHDVKRLRFSLPTPAHVVGLPTGQHISLKFTTSEGKEVQRSYTPVSSDHDKGFVDFVVKVYPPNPPKFPNGGVMSQHLDSLKVGDTIAMKGPKGHLHYKGRGRFTITHRGEKTEYFKKKIGMVAGGTGITPMLQVIREIARDPRDNTEVWLIFANQTEADIFMRQELEGVPKERFHLWYTLDRPPADWKYSTGFINKDMCKAHLPPPAQDTMLFLCGPKPMIEFACEPAFKELGFNKEDWFVF